ncbi:Thiol-disulfide isomerase or thioredoxin [Marinobacter daqiaonensis]|uniref:Thiol-disulfide isomerase or thioredoxin n=1 Tax=Marinobacter daqiaonensis TaxID=650891 RepID=A0A1I6GF64_9GAMM|nr:TlpA disulfide reductase family protein [Marinobacter daqiaonensis]SFR40853.1 Thiol-disulfide isomerase or thioredoxin [Marinobacter daqiaonensis]
MRKYPVFLAVTIAVTIALAGCDEPPGTGSSGNAGDGNPSFATATGDSLGWSSLRGEWVLINYWAEWCKPCLEEIPELNEVDAVDGIRVLAVNFDGIKGQALVGLGERMGIEFTMLAEDPAPELGWTLPGALPATFVVTPDGELKETLLGPQTKDGLLALTGQD